MALESWFAENPITVWLQENGLSEYQLMRKMNRLRRELGRTDTKPVTYQLLSALRKGNPLHRDIDGRRFPVNANDLDLLARATGVDARAMLQWLSKSPASEGELDSLEHYWKLANPLKCLREIMRVSNESLTKRAQVSGASVGKVENGTMSSLGTLSKIARAMGIDFRDFVGAYIEWLQARPLSYQEKGTILVHDVDFSGFEKVVADLSGYRGHDKLRIKKARQRANGTYTGTSGGTEELPQR